MKRTPLTTTAVVLGALLAACSSTTEGDDVSSSEAAVSGNRGHDLFFAEFPGLQGNGRACATCHVESDNFILRPASVEARWNSLQARRKHDPTADDPLFRSIDADDGANDFSMLRQHALVRVTLAIPSNVRMVVP